MLLKNLKLFYPALFLDKYVDEQTLFAITFALGIASMFIGETFFDNVFLGIIPPIIYLGLSHFAYKVI